MSSASLLSGQTILITGATGDIGRAIVTAVADLGGHPIIHYRTRQREAENLLEKIGVNGALVQADLMESDGALRLWDAAEDAAGRIHSLVNNAGIRTASRIEDPFETWALGWEQDVRVNLRAPADLCRNAIPHFRRHGGGRIINITSRAAHRGYSEEFMPYGASKAGLVNLTKSIARYFGPDGIVAVAVSPGFVRTQMAEDFIRAKGRDVALGDIPVGKMVEPKEVADVVCLALRPDQLSLSGATLDINGASYVR